MSVLPLLTTMLFALHILQEHSKALKVSHAVPAGTLTRSWHFFCLPPADVHALTVPYARCVAVAIAAFRCGDPDPH